MRQRMMYLLATMVPIVAIWTVADMVGANPRVTAALVGVEVLVCVGLIAKAMGALSGNDTWLVPADALLMPADTREHLHGVAARLGHESVSFTYGIDRDSRLNAMAFPATNTVYIDDDTAALPADQMRGVVAHELAHLRQRGTVAIKVLAVYQQKLLGPVCMVAVAYSLWRTHFAEAAVIAGMYLVMPFVTALVIAAGSRLGEMAADRVAKSLGYGPALAAALESTSDPAKHGRVLRMFSTHPTTAKRVRALR